MQPGPVEIQGAEAHHLAAVCRLRPGNQVCLFNGDGREYPAEVREVERKRVRLQVLEAAAPARELNFRLEVAAPLPKGDRAQFLVEKLTELGATTLVPLRTRRSVVHPGEGKRDKLERYVVEASKQCGRNVLLRIEPLVDWATYCGRGDLSPTRVLAHPGGQARVPWRSQDKTLAVGPEGGFTEEEIELARASGWQVADLGPRILRVETAALVLAAWGAGGFEV
ncbi:MAG: 16S rRNA (uracil(1498)-N(3))-methyltransferase [Planctomycetes bacterium]|nr:16S rRNA (uracil(1498)-N(3))-methyltransferase [Planctomycetota bacterium]